MDKLEFIKSYINRCDEIITAGNISDAEKLQDEIIGIFESEITGIKSMLDNYTYGLTGKVNFIGDLKLIKQKLMNYMINIQTDYDKRKYDLELARLKQPQVSAHAEANPTQTATAMSNITNTIEQTIRQLDEISEDILTIIDKDILKEYLVSLEGIKATKDKNMFWGKAKEILKFLADKGADAAIATLPYIISSFKLFSKS